VTAETTWSRLASDVVAAAELAEELEQDLEATRRELMDSRKAQRRAEQERDEAVEARFTAKTVLEALKLAEACFPDRLVVLTSARASAEPRPTATRSGSSSRSRSSRSSAGTMATARLLFRR
jgi:hypothetical protein